MVQEGELALGTPGFDLPADSVAVSDSPVAEPEPRFALVYPGPPEKYEPPVRPSGNLGVSFILTGLFILFFIIAIRFRNNIKYVVAMIHNLLETKTRHNVFDDTVRETSLIVLLNLMWIASAGIVCFVYYRWSSPGTFDFSRRAEGMLAGMAMAAVYTIFMLGAYRGVGWIFSDNARSNLWVKGYASCQALMAPVFFVAALTAISRPSVAPEVAFVAVVTFVACKLLFIWKGYRIFFSQFSSWVLFLCYLCSLEIVPLVFCYRCAILLGQE